MSPEDANAITLLDPLCTDDAYQRVVAFARHFGEPHTILAMHAALPLGLTPEIVHLIRINFASAAPLIAEADLLLSPLCREVGRDLYEMFPDVRDLLLEELKSDPEFGPSRVVQIAEFLLAYAERAIKLTKSPEIVDFLRAQQWVALAYARPKDAAQSLALALREGLESANRDETIRIANLTQVLATPLIAEEKVLLYAAGVEKLAAGDRAGASRLLEAVGPTDESPSIGNVSLPSPSELMQVLGGSFPTHQVPAPLVLYPNLNCPGQIIINQKFNLSVQLLSEPPGEGIEAIYIKDTGVHEQLPEVEVVLRVSGFDVEDSNVKLLRLQRDNVSQEEFVLIPHQLNDQQIQVEFYQYSQLIGTANCHISVVTEPREQATKRFGQHEELQKLYALLDEKILRLRKARIIETNSLVLFKLDKQIEAEEEERRKIAQQIDNLESVASSEELYRALLRLGYREQVRSFLKFLKAQSIGAFLIHGLLDHGQRWLLNRLVTQHIRFGTMGKMVRIELDRIGRRRDISALWRELGGRVGLGRQHSSTEIAERVFQWWKTQNVILVFHDVDCMPEGYLQELLHDFWMPLASQAREVISQTNKYYQLLMFLVDYEGIVGAQDTSFVEQLEPTWEPSIPIKLPPITPFSTSVLTDWIETVEIEFDTLPLVEVINQVDDLAQEILSKSDNGVPELVFSEICDLCGYNWYEERERWLQI